MSQRELLIRIAKEQQKQKPSSISSFLLIAWLLAIVVLVWCMDMISSGQLFSLSSIGAFLIILFGFFNSRRMTSDISGGKIDGSNENMFQPTRGINIDESLVHSDLKRRNQANIKTAQRMRDLISSPKGSGSKFIFESSSYSNENMDSNSYQKEQKNNSPFGNSWSNAKALVDFSTFNHKSTNKQEDTSQRPSTVLHWHSPNSSKQQTQRSLSSSYKAGNIPLWAPSPEGKAEVNKTSVSFSTTPQQNSTSFRRSDRYYASPPESISTEGEGSYWSGGRSRSTPMKPVVKDCLQVLGLEYVEDQYILNLRRILGSYLMDSVARFDVLVKMITEQLLTHNKINPSQAPTVQGLLGHTIDIDPSPLIGMTAMSEVTLTDVLNFCRRHDVREALVVCDKSTGMVSDLATEYDSLLCLFRIAGDHFSTTHRHSIIPAVPLSNTAPTAQPIKISFSPSFAPSITPDPNAGKGFYSDLSSNPNQATGASQLQLVGAPISSHVIDREANKRATAYIIRRSHELARDNHLGDYKWSPAASTSVQHHPNGMLGFSVEDAEIVMSVFLHFCDSNFSPLVASEEHRFSSLRFVDATSGLTSLPNGKASVCIARKSYDPIHFVVVTQEDASQKLTELTVRSGRQNVFETILLFLLLLRKSDPSFSGNPRVRGVMDDLFSGYSDMMVSNAGYRKPYY